MPFCPNDKSMLFPVAGKMTCKKCGYELGGKIQSRPVTSHKAEVREITVLDDADMAKMEILPKMKAECPNCGNGEAYYRTQQTRKSDEPETAFLRCTKCDHRWRKY
jgi:DNA-directed RNA polymerase subunit M